MKNVLRSLLVIASVQVALAHVAAAAATHVWELQEIELRASKHYANPYTDVECWVELKGPGFAKRIYGFWDGSDTWRVRLVATVPGRWTWASASNQTDDRGLNGQKGSFAAAAWTAEEMRQNPNRHGFIRSTANGHALQYADGTPFFLVGDTWLSAATWRLPFTGEKPDPGYQPGPGITFEEAVAYRKGQGYNSVSLIAAFPTWASDHYANTYSDKKGIAYRNAWEKFGVTVPGGRFTAKDMHDERGYRPFEIVPNHEGLPDFDRIIPYYFQSLDRKMTYLNEQGFIAMLETTRRDNTPPWKAYFKFNESYSRFVEYMVARYGAFNMIFSKIHLDAIPRNFSLSAGDFNEALIYHLKKYGPMPFGQPVTALIDHSTYTTFGHAEKAPWITIHSVGNNPRDHSMYAVIETLFHLSPPFPAVDLEPYYTGWVQFRINNPAGESPALNGSRDNYFARSMMYGCVLSGALSGHVYGTAGWDITTTGEPAGSRPYFWDVLKYPSGDQMQWMAKFILSEGRRYQDLLPASADIAPRKAEGSKDNGLDGWALMARTKEKDLGLLYFETAAARASLADWSPNGSYRLTWYNTRNGEWGQAENLTSDARGTIQMPVFPDGAQTAEVDWAAKIVAAK